jgi:hypothetical protein
VSVTPSFVDISSFFCTYSLVLLYRFDSELASAHEDAREEKSMREKLQRERDSLLSEKYTLDQTLQGLKLDHQAALDKADRFEKEMNDILMSGTGKDNSEVSICVCGGAG